MLLRKPESLHRGGKAAFATAVMSLRERGPGIQTSITVHLQNPCERSFKITTK